MFYPSTVPEKNVSYSPKFSLVWVRRTFLFSHFSVIIVIITFYRNYLLSLCHLKHFPNIEGRKHINMIIHLCFSSFDSLPSTCRCSLLFSLGYLIIVALSYINYLITTTLFLLHCEVSDDLLLIFKKLNCSSF